MSLVALGFCSGLNDAIRHLLSFDGRIVSEEELAEREAAANEYGDTGSAMRLTLVSRRLS